MVCAAVESVPGELPVPGTGAGAGAGTCDARLLYIYLYIYDTNPTIPKENTIINPRLPEAIEATNPIKINAPRTPRSPQTPEQMAKKIIHPIGTRIAAIMFF